MSQRLFKFQSLNKDPWYGLQMPKLKQSDIGIIEKFISDHGHLTLDKWEMAINRHFLGIEDKPKRWTLIMEILTVVGKV